MIYGYARVSCSTQNLSIQLQILQEKGCQKIYKEKISSRKKYRPELEKVLAKLQKGDTLIVYKLDRLGRSIQELLHFLQLFQERGVTFLSIKEHINTQTATSRLLTNLLLILSEFERDLISERTIDGLKAAKAAGKILGRPKGMTQKTHDSLITVRKLLKTKNISVTSACKLVSISTNTYYRYTDSNL